MNIENRRIIDELRREVKEAFVYREEAMMSLIDALTVGPRISTPVELSTSPVMKYQWPSLYTGMRFGKGEKSIERLRQKRMNWLDRNGEEIREEESRLAGIKVRVLDATNYDRPKTKTVKLVYAHSADGFKPGHTLSILSERVAQGSWYLPLETALVDIGTTAREFGAKQIVEFVKRRGWEQDYLLALDADYTKEPVLRPMHEAGVNILGRVAQNRKFYLPPPPYSGRGRPHVRGKKIKLNDGRTLPEADSNEIVELKDGRYCEVSRYNNVRMYQWPEQPLALYRVIEYKANGEKRFHRPLWLIYIQAQADINILTPAQAQIAYSYRFGIEHSLRFEKSELGIDCGQFNGEDALSRIQLWVELIATSFWMLFALRVAADSKTMKLPLWWKNRELTPGAVRRLALGLFVRLGIEAFKPKPRGKSPGRAEGSRFEPRKRYRIFRKRKRKTAA